MSTALPGIELASEIETVNRGVCVYCASSASCAPEFHAEARELGSLLARAGRTIVYGGSRAGSMGALADGALAAGGRVIGVLPRFLKELEVAHDGLTELHVVDDMRARKHGMLMRAAAVVALPGGSGTLEELMEAITLKRLGIFLGPIVLLNSRGYFDPLLALLDSAIKERFMDERHRAMWGVADSAAAVLPAIARAAEWSPDARRFAAL
jgi:uncharacterized protein (TIGR00730 family)